MMTSDAPILTISSNSVCLTLRNDRWLAHNTANHLLLAKWL